MPTRVASHLPLAAGTIGRISVERLSVSDFRCHRQFRIDCDDRPVVLTGANGVGKTSVLEALSLLAPGRGLRNAKLDDFGWTVGANPPARWAVAARIRSPSGLVDIGTGAEPTASGSRDRRAVHIDGKPVRGQTALSQMCAVVWLTPEMDRLFRDAAASRRRFLDRLVFAVDEDHAARVNAYERAMQERSRLLRAGGADPRWLGALEETMAETGIAVSVARQELIEQLNEVSKTIEGPFPRASLSLIGAIEAWLAEGSALHAEDRFRESLAASRPIDAETGGAATGPHRCDLLVRHGATARMADQCSTGEQKALLIAIIIASIRVRREVRGSSPLVLLDEVAAHLDDRHRHALFETVTDLDAQAWYAGTDIDIFAPLSGQAQFVEVPRGQAFTTPAVSVRNNG